MKKLLSIALSVVLMLSMIVTALPAVSAETIGADTYSVTILNKTEAVISNTSLEVKKGDSYSTTISIKNKEEMGEIKVGVIMDDGTIVKPKAVDDYTLSVDIPKVTGNLYISAYTASKSREAQAGSSGYGEIVRVLENVVSDMPNVKYYSCEDYYLPNGSFYFEETFTPKEGYEIKEIKAVNTCAYLYDVVNYFGEPLAKGYDYREQDMLEGDSADTLTKNEDGSYTLKYMPSGSMFVKVVAEKKATHQDKDGYAKVNHLYDSADCSSNKATYCRIGDRYTTTLEAKPYMNTEYTITDVLVVMNKDTFVAPKRVNDNKVIIDIPYVTGDITIGVLKNTKLYPFVGETLGCFATNMENVSFYRCYSDGLDDILLENQIFKCAVAPYSYKVVPDEGYEIVSFTPKTVSLNRDTGEYTFDECSFEKTDNNEYLVKEWGRVKFEGEVRKIQSPSKLSASQLTLKAGESKTLKVTDGTAKSWATSNKNVATVNNGKVTAVSRGTATITATLTTGEKLTCKVTVSGMHAHSSVGYPTNITVNVGSKIGWDPCLGKWASCVSSNKNVAIVNSNKVIKGISKGKAVISIKAKCGCTAKCTVTVKQPVTKIKLSLTKKTLKVKESCKIKAVATPGNANNSQIKWTTSNKKVACVTKEKTKSKKWNCIKAKKKGSAVIKAKAVDGSKTYAICKITVK